MSFVVQWLKRFHLESLHDCAQYDRSTNFVELEVNVPRTIGILHDEITFGVMKALSNDVSTELALKNNVLAT